MPASHGPRTVVVSVLDPAAGHCWPTPLLETPRNSQAGKSGSGSFGVPPPFSWALVHTRFCLCPLRVCPWGGSEPFCWIPRLGNLLWALELLLQCQNLFGVIFLQFIGCLLSGSAAATAAKSLQSCPTLCDPQTAAHQVPPSLGFSRQEHWSGLPFPSPMH